MAHKTVTYGAEELANKEDLINRNSLSWRQWVLPPCRSKSRYAPLSPPSLATGRETGLLGAVLQGQALSAFCSAVDTR